MYYALLAMIEKELAELEGKLKNATDWEKVELKERIGGWLFGKECLRDAWQRREGVRS